MNLGVTTESQIAFVFAAVGGVTLLGGGAYAAETQLVPERDMAPTLSVEQPINPLSSKLGGPVLVSMSVRMGPTLNNRPPASIIPGFHFVAPNGNAVRLHREIVATDANGLRFNPTSFINIPAEAQIQGAVLTGGWSCGQALYCVTISAYIMDSEGARSNALKYTATAINDALVHRLSKIATK